ncbi:N-acetylated-alpha-linked acidic dipeptidase 2 [Nematostella vectensis]|uniref:N-acetylated-alpha-linked acidic dipeptidase 2 n=1 Tax=Nematostella vectensis TaxID=45351 RepID=UPI00207784C9|nr:N-acetylated-alpha-linked acidic dipeptidase 2 [Nematostella vectensis]XP_048578818.1 N-acetylated-alpha-linked acidic dipeptidase 2 [Nematostella vectensis]XP_048578819.1 N-acetylated-alpha-linked acidic dipeptidase 2 [Nematostella vectensis]
MTTDSKASLDLDDNAYDAQKRDTRRLILISLIVALVAIAIGILAGYFIGVKVQSDRDDSDAKTSAIKQEEENLELHRKAVHFVSAEELKETLRYFTSVPHAPASKETYDQALYIKNKWLSYGFDNVDLKNYSVLLSFPEKPGEIIIQDGGNKELNRTVIDTKFLEASENDSRVLPPFNAFSPAGTVKGKLVYANYGRTSDFEELAKHGINCTGKIVLMRLGKTSRIYKPMRAHKAGAVGLIIFMDPEEYAKKGTSKVYPEYNWLPDSAVQRGTIKATSVRGDTLTPGYPAIPGIYRLPMDEAKKELPQIPVQPISYRDAIPLLRMLRGSVKDSSFQGALPLTYGIEMDPSDNRTVTLTVNTVLQRKVVTNVIGTIRGKQEPDKLVLLGNHRDAWTFGAADGSSGTAALMETSRAMGEIIKKGWRPRRSIVFCSWGAEEPQLMGSAEWLEEFSKLLYSRSVAYLNVDMSVDGRYSFRAKSMPIMDWVLADSAKKVQSPYGNESVFDEWIRKLPSTTKSAGLPKLQEIRSGSDYAVFYQRLGIPCVDIRYTYDRKTAGNPLYHTVHDTFRWMSTLIDPDFRYHRVTTRVWLQLSLTLADSAVLPLNTTRYWDMLTYGVSYFEKRFGSKLGALNVTLDDIKDVITDFKKASDSFEDIVAGVDKNNDVKVSQLNHRLLMLERAFIDNSPIMPGKPFQRHVILTPSYHVSSSYFGGVAEALYRVDQATANAEDVKRQISSVVYGIRSAITILSLKGI